MEPRYERERLIGKARFMSMNYFNSWSALCNRRTCVILILTFFLCWVCAVEATGLYDSHLSRVGAVGVLAIVQAFSGF